MKDALGSKSTTAIFGSKLGHRNKLSNSVKDGLFSKPMLKVRVGSEPVSPDRPGFPGRDNGDANHVASRDELLINIREDVIDSLVDSGAPRGDLPDIPTPGPVSSFDIPMPTERLEQGFQAPSIQPTIYLDEPEEEADDYGVEISERKTIDLSSTLPVEPSSMDPELPTFRAGLEERGLPTIGEPPKMAKPEPPPISIPDLPRSRETEKQAESAPASLPPRAVEELSRPILPTPRELAAKVSPAARQGNQEELARNVLRGEPELRQCLMAEMRLLHSSLGETNEPERLAELTEAILFRLAEVAPQAELLVRAYGLGYQAMEQVSTDIDKAKEKLKFWLTRFAKLF